MKNTEKENNHEDKRVLNADNHGGFFRIRVKGHLDESWSDWLEGLELKTFDNGDMILIGHIGDQAALMGVLNKLYKLNLTLLSVSAFNQNKNNIKGAK